MLTPNRRGKHTKHSETLSEMESPHPRTLPTISLQIQILPDNPHSHPCPSPRSEAPYWGLPFASLPPLLCFPSSLITYFRVSAGRRCPLIECIPWRRPAGRPSYGRDSMDLCFFTMLRTSQVDYVPVATMYVLKSSSSTYLRGENDSEHGAGNPGKCASVSTGSGVKANPWA